MSCAVENIVESDGESGVCFHWNIHKNYSLITKLVIETNTEIILRCCFFHNNKVFINVKLLIWLSRVLYFWAYFAIVFNVDHESLMYMFGHQQSLFLHSQLLTFWEWRTSDPIENL